MKEGKLTISLLGNPYGYEEFRIEKLKEGGKYNRNIWKHKCQNYEQRDYSRFTLKTSTEQRIPSRKVRIYMKTKKGPVELNITFQNGIASGEVTKNGSKNSQKIKVDPSALILDNNVFAHYFVLVERYDFIKGGKQKFSVFIPQNGFQVALRVGFKDRFSFSKAFLKNFNFPPSKVL